MDLLKEATVLWPPFINGFRTQDIWMKYFRSAGLRSTEVTGKIVMRMWKLYMPDILQ